VKIRRTNIWETDKTIGKSSKSVVVLKDRAFDFCMTFHMLYKVLYFTQNSIFMKRILLMSIVLAVSSFACKQEEQPLPVPSKIQDEEMKVYDREVCGCRIRIESISPVFGSGSYAATWEIQSANGLYTYWSGTMGSEGCVNGNVRLGTWYNVNLPTGYYRLSFAWASPCGTSAIGTSQVTLESSVGYPPSYTWDLTTTLSQNPIYKGFELTSSCQLLETE